MRGLLSTPTTIFAKSFLPRHIDGYTSRLCLFWWEQDIFHLEDELHACINCPLYVKARCALSSALATIDRDGASPRGRLLALLASSDPQVWQDFGRFLARMRQARWMLCQRFVRSAQWRAAGKFVCAHGVLFERRPNAGCPCMQADILVADWTGARHMPSIDRTLMAIVAVPFNTATFRRMGLLKADLARMT